LKKQLFFLVLFAAFNSWAMDSNVDDGQSDASEERWEKCLECGLLVSSNGSFLTIHGSSSNADDERHIVKGVEEKNCSKCGILFSCDLDDCLYWNGRCPLNSSSSYGGRSHTYECDKCAMYNFTPKMLIGRWRVIKTLGKEIRFAKAVLEKGIDVSSLPFRPDFNYKHALVNEMAAGREDAIKKNCKGCLRMPYRRSNLIFTGEEEAKFEEAFKRCKKDIEALSLAREDLESCGYTHADIFPPEKPLEKNVEKRRLAKEKRFKKKNRGVEEKALIGT
jgi:hypothetical protein